MSIINDRTGRHEDDLSEEAMRNHGSVELLSLIEHLEQIVALPSCFGSNVSSAAYTAAQLLRSEVLEVTGPGKLLLQAAPQD